jgi:hypothetical protein
VRFVNDRARKSDFAFTNGGVGIALVEIYNPK